MNMEKTVMSCLASNGYGPQTPITVPKQPAQMNEPKREPDGKNYKVTAIRNDKETNKYICKLYNLLQNNKTIPADCGIKCTDGTMNPTTDPQDAETLITTKMSPTRKRACMTNMLHKKGCKVYLDLLNKDKSKLCFPHLIQETNSGIYLPTSASFNCPNLMRLDKPEKRKEAITRLDHMCLKCLQIKFNGSCVCDKTNGIRRQKPRGCTTCNTNHLLGSCQNCLNKVKEDRDKYDLLFQASCAQEDNKINLNTKDSRMISAGCRVMPEMLLPAMNQSKSKPKNVLSASQLPHLVEIRLNTVEYKIEWRDKAKLQISRITA